MFGRKEQTATMEASEAEVESGPFKVEQVTILSRATIARAVEEKLNEGHEKGWQLVSISGQGSPTIIVWNTNPAYRVFSE